MNTDKCLIQYHNKTLFSSLALLPAGQMKAGLYHLVSEVVRFLYTCNIHDQRCGLDQVQFLEMENSGWSKANQNYQCEPQRIHRVRSQRCS